MKNYLLLLKKQLHDVLPAKRSKNRLPDIAGALLILLLVGAMIAVFVFVFSKFVSTYTQIKINRVPDIAARQYEVMSFGYFVLMAAFVLNGINSLCHAIFENSDLSVLISMPFSSSEIFLAKLTEVYLKQAVLALVCVPTLNFTFLCTTNNLNVYNGIMTFIVAPLLPVIPLGIASTLVLPYYYFKRLANSHYIFIFIVMTVGMALFCRMYSFVFGFVRDLISSGKITSLFGDKTMRFVISFTKYDYPANLFANVMLARNLGKSIGLLSALVVAFATICLVSVRAIFVKVLQSGIVVRIPHAHSRKLRFVDSSRFGSLLAKEFLLVMRTPNYAYMYFTTAAVMPVMAYYSASIAASMLADLVGNANVNFEICTFIVVLYSTLTNTFCSTNISRDGYMSITQKTLPYSPAYILGSKIAFCSIIAETSVLICCIVFATTGLENGGDVAATFVAGSLYALAQIVFATRLDLNHPHFAKTDDGEIKESNSTVSSIISIGLAASFTIGFSLMASFFAPFFSDGTIAPLPKSANYAIAICLSLALLGGALGYFFAHLRKAYDNLDSED
ncbi:MAG TPA: hypothetical protein DE061_00760 [Clostridiales bacterium]|nr:hypothetical protein [Clostridiales bacterium]HCH92216.1 hypothetical protein [Clostridiales bacterium]